MKKTLLLLTIVFIFVLTGCSEGITLDNVDSIENNYKYSKVSMGKLKKCDETVIIKDAKNFANVFLARTFNRSYKNERSFEQDSVMYSEAYLSNNEDRLKKEFESISSFYEEYEITTELVNVDYKKVIDVNGDAYLNCVLRIRLVECNNMDVLRLIGYDVLNAYLPCIYNLKLQYVDKEYVVYDTLVEEKEGYLPKLSDLGNIVLNSLSEEERLSHFAYVFSKAQNDKAYYNLTGDEEFKYLSKACIEALNQNGDYKENTKKLYTDYKLTTKLTDCEVLSVTKTDNVYTLKVVIEVKALECKSDDVAINIGFKDGIGGTRKINYEYDIIIEDNEYKLNNSRLVN